MRRGDFEGICEAFQHHLGDPQSQRIGGYVSHEAGTSKFHRQEVSRVLLRTLRTSMELAHAKEGVTNRQEAEGKKLRKKQQA